MFYRGCYESLEGRLGLDAEIKVFEAVENQFEEKKRMAFGFLHYPIFDKKCGWRREADVLIVDKELGIIVIEVKGLKINQIVRIVGNTWEYKEYYTNEGAPYIQAQNQIDMLCQILIDNYPEFNKDITKRVFVGLPYISEKQWEERGFSILPNIPPILFENDLSDIVSKISQNHLHRSKNKIDDTNWEILQEYFSVLIKEIRTEEISTEAISTEAISTEAISTEGEEARYSCVYIIYTKEIFTGLKSEICRLLKRGIKVYLLLYFNIDINFKAEHKDFITKFQLLIYETDKESPGVGYRVIIDGKDFDPSMQENLGEQFNQFNINQYNITHTKIDENLMISAGAGTGKTHVMIDRILYILSTSDYSLKDFSMITFTNDATNEMRKRLKEKFLDLYRLTHSIKYLLYAEDIKDLEISTIDSFAKNLLTHLGHELGYGININVKNLTLEKEDIIRKLVNNYSEEKFCNKEWIMNFAREHNFDNYELINKISQFWKEMHTKGLIADEIKGLNWGLEDKLDGNSKNFQDLFKYVFKYCEEELDLIKKQKNSVSVTDFTRKLKQFSDKEDVWKQVPQKNFLFIDEFQDSDDTQIEMIANLCNYLKCRLFVVGDIKQSIYKFRGANVDAFNVLESQVEKDFKKISLNKNYRTKAEILEFFHEMFQKWGAIKWLPYDKNDKLEAMQEYSSSEESYKIIDSLSDIEAILKNFKKESERGHKLAFIVRRNAEVEQIKKWCEQKEIEINIKVDQLFYKCDAVKDFNILLSALLYPQKAKYVVEALMGPYFGLNIPLTTLAKFKGENNRINKFLHELQEEKKHNFYTYVEQLKSLPVMSVIQNIIQDEGLFSHLKHNKKLDRQYYEQYKKDLGYLMNIIQTKFSLISDNLYSIHEWLELQIRVDKDEKEPLIETNSCSIAIITAHKSKGLEYHTVILPYMTNDFNRINKNIYFLKEDKKQPIKVGWHVSRKPKDKGKRFTCNNLYYSDFKKQEKIEVKKEETRLLYVALTRVREQLIINLPKNFKQNTWSALISYSKEKRWKKK